MLGLQTLDLMWLWLAAAAVVSGLLAYVGAMVGLVLGQFRLPLLLVALGSAPAAAASNLAISSLGAGTGAFTHAREGRVELRLLLSIGLPSAVAAYVTSRSIDRIDGWWIEVLIGATLLVSAVPIARRARSTGSAGEGQPGDQSAAPKPEPRSNGLLLAEVLIGTILGALSGVVGLLLGTMRLPAMLRLGVSAPKAAGTNMAIGFFTGVAGALGALQEQRVSIEAFVLVGGATLIGAWLGAKRTKSLPSSGHFALIAIVLAVVGVWLVVSALI
ncbi:MAG TPA: sulfite exporter TauE/SafE family protein [Enhygromyxa sp.]|nr:sulfite exporter TauE/SafE family protein [Enhygromyxa sp.]